LQKDSSAIQEVKVVEIEERLNAELTRRREIERKLIVLNDQVRNQKHLDHLNLFEPASWICGYPSMKCSPLEG
jgi:hypothetical protein